jgi:predicted secreted protein
MSAGDYSANITIAAPGASNSPQVVPVSLHISSPAPEISCKPESLTFTAVEGGSTPANGTLEVWNSGIGTLNWSLSDDAAWLSESPTSGSSTSAHDTVAVSVDTTGMSAGDYSANITITADGAINSPWTVPVSLHISSAASEISFNPESLTFTAVEGGSTVANGTLEVWNSGIGTLTWSLSDDAAWLSENATSGSSTGEHDTVAVSVDIIGMSAGDYSANITITAPGASNTPQTVPVSLHMGEIGPPPGPALLWLSQYWWTIVAGIVVVVLLVYFLRRRRGV